MLPPRECSGNYRGHTRGTAKVRAIQEWRSEAGKAALVARALRPGSFGWLVGAARIVVDIEIAWCCGRRSLDDDNAIHACKPARDGIADVLLRGKDGAPGDDSRMVTGTITQRRGGGTVTFRLRPREAQ